MNSLLAVLLMIAAWLMGVGVGVYVLVHWILSHSAGDIVACETEDGQDYLTVNANCPIQELTKQKYVIFAVKTSR